MSYMNTSSNLEYTFNNQSSNPEVWDSLYNAHMEDYDEEPIEPDEEAGTALMDDYDDDLADGE